MACKSCLALCFAPPHHHSPAHHLKGSQVHGNAAARRTSQIQGSLQQVGGVQAVCVVVVGGGVGGAWRM